MIDFDNDGDRDLFIAAGHLHDNAECFDTTTTCHERNVLHMNLGNGRFANVSDRCGNGLAVQLSSRGAAGAEPTAAGTGSVWPDRSFS
jgi:hypothetical protein